MINRTTNKGHHSQHRAVVILRSPSPDKAELTSSPTDETCRSFYEAYEHFNEVLFDNQLSGFSSRCSVGSVVGDSLHPNASATAAVTKSSTKLR
jgi:hypothetical protein